jgi:type II secretory pathway pseudopilin PulG
MIVGAWAAYLVPMWLRRQDELNEARPTERFSTAIRLLTRGRRPAAEPAGAADATEAAGDDSDVPAAPDASADVRAFAEPVTTVSPSRPSPSRPPGPTGPPNPRAKVLARRRRTTMGLLLAFTLCGVFALTTGSGFPWLPAVPAVLLIAYVTHVRRQERRRYAVAVDRRRAEDAARRLRRRAEATPPPAAQKPARKIVEQTDHAEWVDQQRRRTPAPEDEPQSWEPAPVPLPTYVNAPVAPRTNRRVDLEAPDTWSAARSTTAGGAAQPAPAAPPASAGNQPGPQRTPLFDQYADDDHRRAAGE